MKHPNHEAELRRYERLLAGTGIERGLIGPREADRLWLRHILNCAVVVETDAVVPIGATVVDVGSGAGLPGLVWAIERPDLRVTLVESLLRRTNFLTEAVAELGLSDRVTVLRGRAEDVVGAVQADVATARAVAPLTRLLPWLTPLMAPQGQILAFKGATAADEVAEAAGVAQSLGLGEGQIRLIGDETLDPPTRVVQYRRRRP